MNISSGKYGHHHAHPSLRQYFPNIPSRKKVLANIRANPSLSLMFDSWSETQQQQFLDLCSGVRGVKLLYDSFFKEIMDPVNHPHRLEKFLSLLASVGKGQYGRKAVDFCPFRVIFTPRTSSTRRSNALKGQKSTSFRLL